MKITLRAATPEDFLFARSLYYETMREVTEGLFGWDQAREDRKFAEQFKLDEVKIIVLDTQDVGWLQTQVDNAIIMLGQLYVSPSMQRRGIGTNVLKRLISDARRDGKCIMLGVMKTNPARRLYERHGFRTTHEDQYKFYMRLDLPPAAGRRREP
jgi:ribosomal protein S18 acetylase RimI-like enzyme